MKFHSKIVADLHWALSSEVLLGGPQMLSTAAVKDWLATDIDLLHQLNENPKPLQDFVSQSNRKKLGFYFENLLHFYFIHSTRFELIHANQQVKNEHKTIGEFDFLVLDYVTNELLHLEVALKFYMNYTLNVANEFWVGPTGNDTLAIKLNHLYSKQLLIFQAKESLEYIQEFKQPVKSRALLKGYFLVHPNLNAHLFPANSNRFFGKLNWLYLHEIDEFLPKEFTYHILVKLEWMLEDSSFCTSPNYTFSELKKVLGKQLLETKRGAMLLQHEAPMAKYYIQIKRA